MGLFDFVTGGGDKPEDELTKTVEVSQDRLDDLRAKSITEKVAALNIDGEQVSVTVKGEVATLIGSAPNQEALEKIVLCAGNQYGVGRVDCQLAVDESVETAPVSASAEVSPHKTGSASVFYTVQPGDTLSKIAQEQYGDAGKYTVIFEANQPMLKNPDKIYPGQSLRVPPL